MEERELESFNNYQGQNNDETLSSVRDAFTALPPTDRGWHAWLVLGTCFWIEALAWGFPLSFGLFENYYATHELFSSDPSAIPVIGTTALGIMYFSSPLVSWVIQKFPQTSRLTPPLGLVILLVGLVASSFSMTVPQLIATQGVIYGLGGAILYFPAISFLDEWFVHRKGLAFGVMWSGSGAAGIVIPFLMNWLLDKYGFRTALRVWAGAMACLTTPMLFFLRPRVPYSLRNNGNGHRARPVDLKFLSMSVFWILEVSNIFVHLGYFMPTVYIPSYARQFKLSSNPSLVGATALALFNLANVLGAIGTGTLIDRMHVTSVTLISTCGAIIAVLVFWGFAVSTAMLYVFSITYGYFAGGFSVTWSGCTGAIRNHAESVYGQGSGANIEAGMVMASLAAGKGMGAVIGGPLSSKLIQAAAKWDGTAAGAYGSRYGGIVIFTGVSTCFGCLSWVARRLGFL